MLIKRVVPLLVEPRHGDIPPYPYTGFVAECGGGFFWVTAAHCAQSIGRALKEYPSAALAFLSFADPQGRKRIDVPRGSWSYVDWQGSLALFRRAKPSIDVSARDVELFDAAFWPLENLTKCDLLNHGITPFTEADVLVDAEELNQRLPLSENGMYVAGVPELSHKVDHERKLLELELKVFPLHPHPDNDDPKGPGRKMENEGRGYTWVPTSWEDDKWDEHVVGISGGPMVILSSGELFLAGVVTRQRPVGSRPEFVGICDVQLLFEVLREAMAGA